MVLMTAFVVLVFLYSLVSQRLQRTVVTAPMLFTAAGAALILLPAAARELVLDRKALLLVAELGLVMTLFTDASRVSPSFLKAGRSRNILVHEHDERAPLLRPLTIALPPPSR